MVIVNPEDEAKVSKHDVCLQKTNHSFMFILTLFLLLLFLLVDDLVLCRFLSVT